jgi:hypothetical protein
VRSLSWSFSSWDLNLFSTVFGHHGQPLGGILAIEECSTWCGSECILSIGLDINAAKEDKSDNQTN